jgi:hypothetical protein
LVATARGESRACVGAMLSKMHTPDTIGEIR